MDPNNSRIGTTGKKVTMWRSIAFAATDSLSGGYGTLIGMYFMFFLTTFCNISALKAGTIIGLAKLIDTTTAIVMGKLSDNFWKTKLGRKYGRRHFFILFGAPLVLIVFCLLFFPVRGGFLYYLVVYSMVEISVTMVQVPYETLPSEMTTDFDERTKMSTTRMFFSGATGSILPLVGGTILSIMGTNNAYSYTVLSSFFAVVWTICLLVTYKFTWERSIEEITINFTEEDKQRSGDGVIVIAWKAIKGYFSTLKVKAFRQHMYIYLLGVTGQDLFGGAFTYFIVFCLGLTTADASWIFSLGVTALIGAPLNYYLFKKLGASHCYLLFFSMTILGLFGFYGIYLSNLSGKALMVALGIVAIFYLYVKGGAYNIPWQVFPFIPDIDEIMSGQRREGEFAAMMNFIRKVTSGLASIVLEWILTQNGFVTGATHQSAQATSAIAYTMVFGAAGLTLIALLLAQTFRLNPKTHAILISETDQLKKGNTSVPDANVVKVVESLTGTTFAKIQSVWSKK